MRTVSKEKERPPDPKVRASTQSTTGVRRSGAYIQRGSSGTCEIRLSPRAKVPEDKGYRLTKSPGAEGMSPSPSVSPQEGTQS